MIWTEWDTIEAKRVIDSFKHNIEDREKTFYMLCFAMCSPQTTFENNVKVQEELVRLNYYNAHIDDNTLANICKPVRFFNNKAKFLSNMKNGFGIIYRELTNTNLDPYTRREKLISYTLGCGYKVASHFMRNIGFDCFAIIDTHILKYLDKPQPTTGHKYLEYEREFIKCSSDVGLTPAVFDAIIWKTYSNTKWEDFKY